MRRNTIFADKTYPSGRGVISTFRGKTGPFVAHAGAKSGEVMSIRAMFEFAKRTKPGQNGPRVAVRKFRLANS